MVVRPFGKLRTDLTYDCVASLSNLLGNFMRRLTSSESVNHWSPQSVETKLVKNGGRLVRYAGRLVFQLARLWCKPRKRGKRGTRSLK